MVGVEFKGRLGNQFFQYVFLKYLKEKNNRATYFFPNPHHAYLAKYFDLGFYDNLTLGSKLYSGFTRILPSILNFKHIHVPNFVSPKEFAPVDGTIYHGYFQSDFYVKKLANKLNLPIRKRYKIAFDNQFGDIFKTSKTVVVHIRRTDYINYGRRDISLPIAYFKRQLESIPELDQYKVFFVSDDMKHVREAFPDRPNFIFSQNDEITDFQLIKNADVAIISNSTFAWWAAYTCDKHNLVIAPKNWFGFRIGKEHPKGIMTDKFDWREVEP